MMPSSCSRNTQDCYFYDSYYQLELNLQNIRRALIYLLDESEDHECFICNRLRCRCEETFSTIMSSTLSEFGYSFSEISSSSIASELDYIFVNAPPAEALPMPEWEVGRSHRSTPELVEPNDIEKWVKTSTPNADGKGIIFYIDESVNSEVNQSWPPTRKSIWWDPVPSVGAPAPADPVEAFFRLFAEASGKRGYTYF